MYAAAHAWRGAGYLMLSLGYFRVAGGAFRSEAERSVRRALELDPTLGDAMAWSATLAMQYDHDWERAERTLRRAVKEAPNSAAAHDMYGNLLAATGRHRESAQEFEVTLSLDPLSYWNMTNAALCAHRAREFQRAAELFERLLALNPELLMGQALFPMTLAKLGRRAEAAESGRKLAAYHGGPVRPLAALALAEAGFVDEARLLLAECERSRSQQNVWLGGLAMAYAAIGEHDVALTRLEEAYDVRDAWMMWLRVQPEFDSLRGSVRFQELLRKVRLNEASE
jgi:Tfp pilus assembly protein PilF